MKETVSKFFVLLSTFVGVTEISVAMESTEKSTEKSTEIPTTQQLVKVKIDNIAREFGGNQSYNAFLRAPTQLVITDNKSGNDLLIFDRNLNFDSSSDSTAIETYLNECSGAKILSDILPCHMAAMTSTNFKTIVEDRFQSFAKDKEDEEDKKDKKDTSSDFHPKMLAILKEMIENEVNKCLTSPGGESLPITNGNLIRSDDPTWSSKTTLTMDRWREVPWGIEADKYLVRKTIAGNNLINAYKILIGRRRSPFVHWTFDDSNIRARLVNKYWDSYDKDIKKFIFFEHIESILESAIIYDPLAFYIFFLVASMCKITDENIEKPYILKMTYDAVDGFGFERSTKTFNWCFYQGSYHAGDHSFAETLKKTNIGGGFLIFIFVDALYSMIDDIITDHLSDLGETPNSIKEYCRSRRKNQQQRYDELFGHSIFHNGKEYKISEPAFPENFKWYN